MAQVLCPVDVQQERIRLLKEREQLLAAQAALIAKQRDDWIQSMGMAVPTHQSFGPPPGLEAPAPAKTRSFGKTVKFADDLSDDASTCAGTFQSVEDLEDEGTTVNMRGIPTGLTHATLAAVLDKNGFNGEYDLIYVPIDLATGVSSGYATVNLKSADAKSDFMAYFDGFSNWGGLGEKACQVVPTDSSEGLSERVERYRNLRVMHDSVPDAFKPALYAGGERVPFPAPTKELRPPRIQSSGQKQFSHFNSIRRQHFA
jgi:hypothetical protein